MQLNKKNLDNIFYVFISTHLLLWTLIPSLTNNNLPLDTIEALAWGSNLDWGFNKHPPASAFFVEVFYQIFGNLDWAYYFLSQIFIIVSFFFIFKFSKLFFKSNLLGLISVLILEGIYFYNYTTPEFNVYISELPFWTLVVYYSYKCLKKDNLKDWVLLGVFSALGFLSHYLFSYLLLSILIFFIFNSIKDKKFNFKYFIALEVFILLLIPHLMWLAENDYTTIVYAFHRTESGSENIGFLSHIIYPFSYIIKQIGILIPFWIMLFFLIKKFKFKLNFKDKKFIFLLFINFLPIILVALTSFLTGARIKTMWMTPFYLFFGIFFVYLFQNQINLKKLNYFFSSFVFFFLLSPLIYITISLSQDDKRTDYKGYKISKKIEYIWNRNNNKPINIVLGDEWQAGNLSYHLSSRPKWEGKITQKKLDSLLKYLCIDDICVGNR